MLLLWYFVIATSFFCKSGTHKIYQEADENIDRNPNVQSKNNKDGDIAKQLDGDDEIWFDTSDNEEEDYEILDVEEDVIDDDLSYSSDERNYERLMNYIEHEKSIGLSSNHDNKDSKNQFLLLEDVLSNEMADDDDIKREESILLRRNSGNDKDSKIELLTSEEFSSVELDGMNDNYVKQEKSISHTNNNDNDDDSKNELLSSEDFFSDEVDGMTDDTEGDDFNESERFKRGINVEDLPRSLDNWTYDKNDMLFRQDAFLKEYKNRVLQPNPYTNVYDYEHATPEIESRENQWKVSPCVTNLRELYTCIFCSKDPWIRQQFMSCYELIPKRIKSQNMKCFTNVLELPFDEGSDQMDYFDYICKKFKSVKKILKCTASSLPELPRDKFVEEERGLAKYSYCLHAINSRHCC